MSNYSQAPLAATNTILLFAVVTCWLSTCCNRVTCLPTHVVPASYVTNIEGAITNEWPTHEQYKQIVAQQQPQYKQVAHRQRALALVGGQDILPPAVLRITPSLTDSNSNLNNANRQLFIDTLKAQDDELILQQKEVELELEEQQLLQQQQQQQQQQQKNTNQQDDAVIGEDESAAHVNDPTIINDDSQQLLRLREQQLLTNANLALLHARSLLSRNTREAQKICGDALVYSLENLCRSIFVTPYELSTSTASIAEPIITNGNRKPNSTANGGKHKRRQAAVNGTYDSYDNNNNNDHEPRERHHNHRNQLRNGRLSSSSQMDTNSNTNNGVDNDYENGHSYDQKLMENKRRRQLQQLRTEEADRLSEGASGNPITLALSSARSLGRVRRGASEMLGVADECCKKACTAETMLEFCGKRPTELR